MTPDYYEVEWCEGEHLKNAIYDRLPLAEKKYNQVYLIDSNARLWASRHDRMQELLKGELYYEA